MAQLKDTLITGGLRVTDTTITDVLQTRAIKALTSSDSDTYGLGATGQVLTSDGTNTYWSNDILAANDAMVFKGTLGTGGTVTNLPSTDYSAGWTYRVATAGTYAGEYCEAGDLIIAVKDYVSPGADTDWAKIEHNIDGAIFTGSENGVANELTENRLIYATGTNQVASSSVVVENDNNIKLSNKIRFYNFNFDMGARDKEAGWRRICKVYAISQYQHWLLGLTGTYSSEPPTTALIAVTSMNTTIGMTLLSSSYVNHIKKIRLKNVSGNIWWLDIYIEGTAGQNGLWSNINFSFSGNVTVSDIQTSTDINTDTGGAELTLRSIKDQPVFTLSDNDGSHSTTSTFTHQDQTIKLPATIKATLDGTATQVSKNLTLKINSGTTEGTSLYTYNGSTAKTLDIKAGTGVTLTAAAGSVTVAATPIKLGFGYGTCATAAATAAKVVTLSNYALVTGGYVTIKFTYAVPASATLNINSTGAKSIFYKGAAIAANVIRAGDTITFIYDGTNYNMIADLETVQNKLGANDVNTLYDTGFYNIINGSATNTPKNYGYGQLLVISYNKHRGNTSPGWASQIYMQAGDNAETSTKPGNNLYFRTSNNATWHDWQKAVHVSTAYEKVGDTNNPVYIAANGTATAINYTIDANVPSTAVFTDKYIDVTARGTTKAYLLADTIAPTSDHSATAVAESDVYLDTTAGKLAATIFKLAEKAEIQYNTTTNAIDFNFI